MQEGVSRVKEQGQPILLLTHLLQCGPSSQTRLKSFNDPDPNHFIVALVLPALTEVQVKVFGSCTTIRSLIMKNKPQQAGEFDSFRFSINVTLLNSDKLLIF